jgi:hypothetical protein
VSLRKVTDKSITHEGPKVERVPLSSLSSVGRKRHGKEYELMKQVLKELADLPSEFALKLPLRDFSAEDLRSAVSRAAASKTIEISSTSDRENLYVWKRR